MININNQIFTNIILLILILLNVGLGYALWQSNKPHHPPKPQKIVKLFEDRLDLSEEQVGEFIELVREHHTRHKRINKKQINYRTELFDLMIEEELDTIKIQKTLTLFSATESEKFQSLIDHYQNLKATCTPEQQKKLHNFFKNESRQRQRSGSRKPH